MTHYNQISINARSCEPAEAVSESRLCPSAVHFVLHCHLVAIHQLHRLNSHSNIQYIMSSNPPFPIPQSSGPLYFFQHCTINYSLFQLGFYLHSSGPSVLLVIIHIKINSWNQGTWWHHWNRCNGAGTSQSDSRSQKVTNRQTYLEEKTKVKPRFFFNLLYLLCMFSCEILRCWLVLVSTMLS